MKTKIGCVLLALLVCVQALAAPNAYAWARRRLAVSPARQFLISVGQQKAQVQVLLISVGLMRMPHRGG